ncbi:hypothetical protein J2045_003529 [Peteryoungia aggregata LMG 23059]|uniref:Uncharacterized protein n=1 Tax=Peteryoungia aggregata LMG 23059 TaxID=1368425 RepID=A0ABU0GCL3_9HYPH|nr:hypothetical protein [Peteryoungia aggregata]MDQ0422481.1 hypothetical protein [Peteryoungia aggregata LMG 23059]
MVNILRLAALAVPMFALTALQAGAWTRDAQVYGRGGQASIHATGTCAGHSCSRQITRTGPYGRSVTRQGSASCAYGICTGSTTTTGPNGGFITRDVTATR